MAPLLNDKVGGGIVQSSNHINTLDHVSADQQVSRSTSGKINREMRIAWDKEIYESWLVLEMEPTLTVAMTGERLFFTRVSLAHKDTLLVGCTRHNWGHA